MTPASLLGPTLTALVALLLADVIFPPVGAESFDNLSRDLAAVVLGAAIGLALALIVYGDDGTNG